MLKMVREWSNSAPEGCEIFNEFERVCYTTFHSDCGYGEFDVSAKSRLSC